MNDPMSVAAVQAMLDASPFIHLLAMRAVSLDAAAQQVILEMPLTPGVERRAGSGQFHGGAIAALIDTAGDFALVIGLGGGVPTINLRIDYLRPAIGERLRAVASVRRAGRTIGVVDVDVTDPAGRLVAIGRGCYSTVVG
jgi:uncharacterized protein (TIGR00369 family)